MKRLPRGKYAEKARRSFAVALVDPEIFAYFGSSEAVNEALRAVVQAVGKPKRKPAARARARSRKKKRAA